MICMKKLIAVTFTNILGWVLFPTICNSSVNQSIFQPNVEITVAVAVEITVAQPAVTVIKTSGSDRLTSNYSTEKL